MTTTMTTTTVIPTTTVEIHVQCRNLFKKDTFSQSDAFCVLFQVPNGSVDKENPKKPSCRPSAQEAEVGRSEVVPNSKNPDFATPFRVKFHFEEEQTYVLRVCDQDQAGSTALTKQDYLGGTAFTLGQLLGAKGNSLSRPLKKKKGYVILQAEEVTETRDTLELQLAGRDLKNVDGMFSKSDPFYQVKRINPDGKTWNIVWKSRVVKNDLNPNWSVEQIPLQTLCNGKLDRRIQIQILDWDEFSSPDDMGCIETTVKNLVAGTPSVYDVMRLSNKTFGAKSLKKSGTLSVQKATIVQLPTMLDYISGGCEISLMVAVDFTASNGNPNSVNSLHYRGNGKNEYQSAIEKIGTIVQEYDTNKQFPMWGFGAHFNGTNQPCFPMGHTKDEVRGVNGLLEAYKQTLEMPGFALSGPTNFAPVIRSAMQSANENTAHGKQCYSVLVILTDGQVSDFTETTALIRQATQVPMSIVIIGVGDADFGAMEYLDGDKQVKTRDIVQFVPFRKFMGNVDLLAQETLREIPNQLVQYYLSKGIHPNPPVPTPELTEDEIFVSWDMAEEEDIDVEGEIEL